MADSAVFEFVVGELERTARLGRPAARAAVRSVIERARFDPESLSSAQMQRIVERLLAPVLERVGVEDVAGVCRQINAGLASPAFAWDGPESPDEIFGRMIRR